MSKVHLSDDERLITLTKTAYDNILEKNLELQKLVNERTIRIIHKITLRKYLSDRFMAAPDIDLESSFKIEQYSGDSTDPVLEKVNDLMILARNNNLEAKREMLDYLHEIKKRQLELTQEIKKSIQDLNDMWAKVPKIIRWLYGK